MIFDRYTAIAVVLMIVSIVTPIVIFSPDLIMCMIWGFICGYFSAGVAAYLRYRFTGE